ncbi:hypothetical protein NFI96_017923, partial [Prochilodus magdalenae]
TAILPNTHDPANKDLYNQLMGCYVCLLKLCPKFLHTNSTSHTWPFSAIAELIDNAYDPDVKARQFWIDKTRVKEQDCLIFMDNGAGMDYDKMHKMLSPEPEHETSLQDILRHSLFQTESELHSELKAIDGCSASSTGTRIIIWNLRKTSEGTSEFEFERDRYDIRIPAQVYESNKEQTQRLEHDIQMVPESTYSLRAYCSILYLKPKMQIIIRGQKVKTQLVSKSLAHRFKDSYKPLFLKKPVSITFGYNAKSKEQFGIMMYHKNRLIKAYERVSCQLKANSIGVGVIGVIECDYLQPTHNKQDFDSTDEYRKTMHNVGVKLEDYSKEVRHRYKSTVPIEDSVKRPDQNWVQCDGCLKWRKLPDGIDTDKLPVKWFCHLNPDPQFRSCTANEEAEDSEDEQPRYQKTFKQQTCVPFIGSTVIDVFNEVNVGIPMFQMEEEKKRAEEEKKKAEEKKFAALKEENAALMRKQQDLERQLRDSAPSSPKSPAQATSSSSRNASISTRASSRPSDRFPVISNVMSLSTTPTRMKRSLGPGRESEAKRQRMSNGLCSSTPDSPSTSTASPIACSSPTIDIPDGKEETDNNEELKDDGDDDIVILESCSTPRPNPSTFDLSKVKPERRLSADMTKPHEFNNDTAMETSLAMDSTSAAISTPQEHTSITTQTNQIQRVKEEMDDLRDKNEQEKHVEGRTDNKESETEPMESRTNQKPEETESLQGSPSIHLKSVTSETEQMVVKSEVEAEKKPATPKNPYLAPLDGEHLSMLEAQQQQDRLLELLEIASREREESLSQVEVLKSKVEELQSSLLELTQETLKKEQCQQCTQTSTADGEERDYKALYLQATEEMEQLRRAMDQLKRERVASGDQADLDKREAQENKPQSRGVLDTFNVSVVDNLASQRDMASLLRELDERNKEREELKNKLDRLEDENNTLVTFCENLKKDIKKEKEMVSAEERQTQTEFPEPQPEVSKEGPAGSSNQGIGSTSGTNQNGTQDERPQTERRQEDTDTLACRLRELRQRVGHLLVNFIPALDLEQVNFDCDVIDEILGQVIDEICVSTAASS